LLPDLQEASMKKEYPPRGGYKSSGFGYASDVIHMAVYRDDAEMFMLALAELGGAGVEVLIDGSIFNYAAMRGAVDCLKALFASGAKSEFPLEYWLKKAENPSHGPRVGWKAAA
jgi:hypothetical protein